MSKRKFSSFNDDEAMKLIGIERIQIWNLPIEPFKVSDFFYKRLERLDSFGVYRSEGGKELLIEAFCEEALNRHKKIRLWKQVHFESETLTGTPDYIATKKRDYVEHPFLCVVEAKKDDFEKGLAQCLVEMKACRDNNEKEIDVYGIVSNGEGWKFYKYAISGEVFGTELFTSADEEKLLSALNYIFDECEKNL
jgi:hypothetical protein